MNLNALVLLNQCLHALVLIDAGTRRSLILLAFDTGRNFLFLIQPEEDPVMPPAYVLVFTPHQLFAFMILPFFGGRSQDVISVHPASHCLVIKQLPTQSGDQH